jgi:hypothetical protein
VKWSLLRERRWPKPAAGDCCVPSDLDAVMLRRRLRLTRGLAYTTFVLVTPFFSAPAMPLSPAELDRLRPVLERIVAALGPEEIWPFGAGARL